ncbi:LPS-assembly protein LptD [Verrucomicrobiota bacterium sgz303538]
MKRPLLTSIAILLLGLAGARGQFGSFGDVPIEINAEETRFEAGIAVAEQNVVIRYGDTTIYCDYAQYNPDTRDVLVSGNVRIYRGGRLFAGERAVYNLETKQLTAADFRGSVYPFNFSANTLSTLGPNSYLVRNGVFTTSDNSKPDYVLRARQVRIYPNDRVIFNDVKLYIGKTPVFWFPYIYQSLNKEQAFTITPGYNSRWGVYLLTRYTFPITDNWSGTLRLDFMSDRGIGTGLDSDWSGGTDKRNWGRFRSYIIHDSDPGMDPTNTVQKREPIDPTRYRISLQDRTYFTEDIYSTVDINKLSDARYLEDFEQGLVKRDPNPDNMLGLTKWDEDYTLTLIGRKQLNEFLDFTERLPELALDMKRQPLWKTGIFYEGETSAGFYRRNFADLSLFEDYDSFRVDSFHQFLYPQTYFGWLSVVPRIGLRGTYYSDSGFFQDEVVTRTTTLADGGTETNTFTEHQIRGGGSIFRAVANAGFETSFKLSRAFEQVQSRPWGLDGLRHVLQPFANFSYVWSSETPDDILQFDRINPSTQRPPIDFPQFNAVDAIDNWTILRLGVRNRFQTRRDNQTINWLEWNAFFDINFDRPDFPSLLSANRPTRTNAPSSGKTGLVSSALGDPGTFSNVYNKLRWNPVPWVALNIDSQLPLLDEGFTEVNTSVNVMVTRDVQLNVGHRYLSGNPFFVDSNLGTLGGYLRINDNWAFSFREQYEFQRSTLESQRYELHRDLSSWIASLGVVVRDNAGTDEFGILLTFTLKDLPNVRLPLAFDPEDIGGGGENNSKSR